MAIKADNYFRAMDDSGLVIKRNDVNQTFDFTQVIDVVEVDGYTGDVWIIHNDAGRGLFHLGVTTCLNNCMIPAKKKLAKMVELFTKKRDLLYSGKFSDGTGKKLTHAEVSEIAAAKKAHKIGYNVTSELVNMGFEKAQVIEMVTKNCEIPEKDASQLYDLYIKEKADKEAQESETEENKE